MQLHCLKEGVYPPSSTPTSHATHSCLFKDSTGSSRFNPDSFFPMVLNERVAWPKYMDTVRAALTMQAEAIIKQGAALEAGSSRGGIVAGEVSDGGVRAQNADAALAPSGNISSRRGPSPGLNIGTGTPEPTAQGGSGGGGGAEQHSLTGRHHSSRGELSRPRDLSGVSVAALAELSFGNEGSPHFSPSVPSDNNHPWSTPGAAAADIRQISFGERVQGTTGTELESWTPFRFDLPCAGPVLTVVLDVSDGDPGIVVSKGRLPASMGLGSRNSTAAAVPADAGGPTGTSRGETSDCAASTTAAAPPIAQVEDGGDEDYEWKASPTHRGLRVVKIYPRHPKCVKMLPTEQPDVKYILDIAVRLPSCPSARCVAPYMVGVCSCRKWG